MANPAPTGDILAGGFLLGVGVASLIWAIVVPMIQRSRERWINELIDARLRDHALIAPKFSNEISIGTIAPDDCGIPFEPYRDWEPDEEEI
jgi:hypothetical protein